MSRLYEPRLRERLLIVTNEQNPMKVIRHHHILIQPNVPEMVRNPHPESLRDFADIRKLHPAGDDLAEEVLAIPHTYRHEIPCVGAVIPALQSGCLDSVLAFEAGQYATPHPTL